MEDTSVSSGGENDFSYLTETPVGDRDKHLKIQLCIEYLTKKKETKRSALKTPNQATFKQLNVTISNVKNIPKLSEDSSKQKKKVMPGSSKNPFVKIRLLPDDVIHTTELLPPKKDEVRFYETFEFKFDNDLDDLKEKKLQVQVCADGKVTRGSKSLGEVVVSLATVKLGCPLIKWYDLS